MKTREEIESLKRQWYNDPIWDLEFTDGFEDHRQELWAYRQGVEIASSDLVNPLPPDLRQATALERIATALENNKKPERARNVDTIFGLPVIEVDDAPGSMIYAASFGRIAAALERLVAGDNWEGGTDED